VEGRGVQHGDVVVVSMSIQGEGEDSAEERRTIIPVGENIPGFDEALLGQLPDETREFDLRFPDDYDDAKRAGRQGHFVVTVAAINTRELPEPTDEWIQDLGEAPSMAEFRDQERQRLRQRFDAYADEVASSRAISALVERADIEYPPQMVEDEVDRSLRGLAAELDRAKTTYDEYLAMGGLTREQHVEQLEAQADQRIRTRLALREFANREGLQVTKEETEQAAATARSLADASTLPVGRSAAEHTYSLLNQVVREKVTQRLRDLMDFVDTPVADPGEPGGAEGATHA
jgi:trigger factor